MIPFPFSREDAISIALAVSESARSAYNEDRLHTAADYHRLASMLWLQLDYDKMARDHLVLSHSVEEEIERR